MLPRFATLLAGLGIAGLAQGAPTAYPLTVDNCGKPQVFAQAPQRVVTIGQAGTEMLYALGLAPGWPRHRFGSMTYCPITRRRTPRSLGLPTTSPASRR